MSNRTFDYAVAQESSMASSVPAGGDPERVNHVPPVPAFEVTWDPEDKEYVFARTLVVAPGGLSVAPEMNTGGLSLEFEKTYYCHVRYSSSENDLLAYIDTTETPTKDNNSFVKPWGDLEKSYTAIDVKLATTPKWEIKEFDDTVIEQYHVGTIFVSSSKHELVPFDVYFTGSDQNYAVYLADNDLFVGDTVVPVSTQFNSFTAGSSVRCRVYKSGSGDSETSETYEAVLYTGGSPFHGADEIVSDFAVADVDADGHITQFTHGTVVMPKPGSGGTATVEDKGPWHIVTGDEGVKSTENNWCLVGSKMIEFGSVTIDDGSSGFVMACVTLDVSSSGVTYTTEQGLYPDMQESDTTHFYIPIYKIDDGEVTIDFRNTPTFAFMDLFGMTQG